jgi:hypothetical protein
MKRARTYFSIFEINSGVNCAVVVMNISAVVEAGLLRMEFPDDILQCKMSQLFLIAYTNL